MFFNDILNYGCVILFYASKQRVVSAAVKIIELWDYIDAHVSFYGSNPKFPIFAA
jgi:hypothetical protein